MTIEGENKRESFVERIEGLVNFLYLKLYFRDSVNLITEGNPDKLAELKAELKEFAESERKMPNTFDPEVDEPDEIDPDELV